MVRTITNELSHSLYEDTCQKVCVWSSIHVYGDLQIALSQRIATQLRMGMRKELKGC